MTSISIGYNENDHSAFTAPMPVAGDTRPGEIIPIPCAGASLAPKLTYTGSDHWELTGITMYYRNMRMTS